MNEPYDSQTANPSIEKYVVASNNGIETHKFTRCVIGYILHGEKYVYYDDKCYKFSQGDLFFLGMGCHYTKNIPEEGTLTNKFSSASPRKSCNGSCCISTSHTN